MKTKNIKLVLYFTFFFSFSCKNKENQVFIYHSDYSSIEIISKNKAIEKNKLKQIFNELEKVEYISQKYFVKKDTIKRIIYFDRSLKNKVVVDFKIKNNNLTFKIKDRKINNLENDYLNDFIKNLKQAIDNNEDINIVFELYLPVNLYNDNNKIQPPPPPPF